MHLQTGRKPRQGLRELRRGGVLGGDDGRDLAPEAGGEQRCEHVDTPEGDRVVGGLLVRTDPLEDAPAFGQEPAGGGVVAAQGCRVGLAEHRVQETEGRLVAAEGDGPVGEDVGDR
ncbi:hypothetical protein [Streptomyces virginiae]|uniref:Uncharacterized protein n=1 Tax=Streptomyces virginiae TaxID=1961 RepID=A0ABZ1TMW2_STRVG|nr:hypothetical protein [Streptomyces virginiae]WTB27218.1 hypothetical protein OG253_40390 [Streptomyces virginiae]